VFHKKNYKYPVLWRHKYNFEKHHSDSTKTWLNLISLKGLSSWLTTCLLCLKDVFFNRQSAFLWVPTVLVFSLTLFVQSRLYTGVSQENGRILVQSINFPFINIEDFRYSKAGGSYNDSIAKAFLLTKRLLTLDFLVVRSKSSRLSLWVS
jgi:hypothetical protein